MRFERITIRDYKAIRSVTIEPRPAGITIIEGDNEIGKSSIAEALWLIFEQNDDSSSQLVKGLKPAGRDAATEIEVVVSSGEFRFRYFKRFHRGARTELEVFEPRRELLSGREAHNRAREILDRTIDRQLWNALRLQQGASLEPLAAGEHQPLLSALGAAAGELLGGDRERTLYDRIEQEYERYFTAAAGRERTSGDGPNAPRLRRDRDEAQLHVERLVARISELEDRAIRSAELGTELAALAEKRAASEARRSELAAQDENRKQLSIAVEAAGNRVRVLEANIRELSAALKARGDAATALARRIEACAEAELALKASAAPLEAAKAGLELAGPEKLAAESALAAAREAETTAESFVRLAERELQAQQMAERLERIERHEPELRAIVAWLNACPIDERALKEIESAERALARAEAQRDAAGATIEVTAPETVTLAIDGKAVEVSPERPLRGRVPGETTLAFDDGVVLTVRAGQQAQDLAEVYRRAERELSGMLRQKRVASGEEARNVLLERGKKDERRRSLAEQLRGDLRDLAADDLREKLGRERAAITEMATRLGPDRPATLDDAKRLRDQASTAREGAEAAAGSAVARWEGANAKFQEIDRATFQKNERLSALKDEIERAKADIDRFSDEETVDSIERRIAELRSEHEAEAASLARAQQSLAAATDVSAELAEAIVEIQRADASLARISTERASIAGVLEDAGADGLHGQLVEAEQRLVAAEQELAAFERRANAARTLFEAMRKRRDEARENYAEPLQKQIEALGRKVLGDSFRIELTDDLRIAKVARQGAEFEISQLSVGLREQLAVLTRLACAALVSDGGGAPVVLDDIFGWADPARLRMLGPVLAEAAKDTQVLLFTCNPQRFESVVPARVIRLPQGAVVDRGATDSPTSPDPIATPLRPERTLVRATTPAAAPPQGSFDLFGEPEPARRN